ncbi:hypothetical protein ACFTZI_35310 [Streptomyces decoyicus]|uniref:hypothetical protein n=1 Tax=Streptomyces decoyicus TaxID=249567 RepID=UPI003644CE94
MRDRRRRPRPPSPGALRLAPPPRNRRGRTGRPPYYPRFGFAPAADRFGILPPQPWPDEAFMALSLNGSLPPRGTVRYAPAFGIA